jgi:hypothetical protein
MRICREQCAFPWCWLNAAKDVIPAKRSLMRQAEERQLARRHLETGSPRQRRCAHRDVHDLAPKKDSAGAAGGGEAISAARTREFQQLGDCDAVHLNASFRGPAAAISAAFAEKDDGA